MTFYEAALKVLEQAAAPLHVADITKRSLDQGLLSHVGKLPEVTMLSRLAAMARRPRDRRIMVTAKDTFALTDWMLNEDAAALAQTGVVEPNPAEGLPPMRPLERHPEPRAEYLRAIGRQAERVRRRDDDRKKKYPPLHEVAFELLSEGPVALVPNELLARLKARELVADDTSIRDVIEGLAEDNQRRVDDGRRPQFTAVKAESGELQLSIEAAVPEGAAAPADAQAAFCAAVGLQFEQGRVVLRSKESARGDGGLGAPSPEDLAAQHTARGAVKDAKRAMARLLRRRFAELESSAFEKAAVKLLHALHFRELKVAKRAKEGPLLTARKREGSLELRYAIRLLRGAPAIERRHVQELRRDLSHHSAHLGLLLTAGEARGDAKSDATQGALVLLWCGEGLADKFLEVELGVEATRHVVYELDEAFFEQVKADGVEAERRREERHRDRPPRDEGQGSGETAAADGSAPAASGAPPEVAAGGAAGADEGEGPDDGEGGEDDGDAEQGEGGAEAAAGEGASAEGGRRRRRRRRRRRGPRPDGPPGAQPAGAGAGGAAQPASEAAAPAAPAPAASPPGDGSAA